MMKGMRIEGWRRIMTGGVDMISERDDRKKLNAYLNGRGK